MEQKDREALYHEIVRFEFDFAKNLAGYLSGGKENISLEKEIIKEIIQQLEAFLDKPNRWKRNKILILLFTQLVFFSAQLKNEFNYETISNIDEEYLNSYSPVELLKGLHDNYHVNYDERDLIFAQKDFKMARQFFVWCVCKYGLPATEAFKIIEQVKIECNERMWVSDLVEKNCLLIYQTSTKIGHQKV